MHTETYEQIFLQPEMVENPLFLKEGDVCEIMFHADKEEALSCDLPHYIEAEVTYGEEEQNNQPSSQNVFCPKNL